MIILEGVDCTGKTSVANAIRDVLTRRELGVMMLKRGKPEPDANPLDEYAGPISTYPMNRHDNLVCDRWHVGEEVYGPLYRGGSRVNRAKRAFIDMLLASRGALLVHVTASHDMIVKRHAERGEDFLKVTDVTQAREAYLAMTADHHHWRLLDTTDMPLDAVPLMAQTLVEIAGVRRHAAEQLIKLKTDYVGPIIPDFLLVGDKPANDDKPTYGAFTPWTGNSGSFLLTALHEAGAIGAHDVPRFGMVNSSGMPLRELHAILGYPRVISLGSAASSRLANLGVPVVGHVRHPQYIRRFQHDQRVEYGNEIMSKVKETSYHSVN